MKSRLQAQILSSNSYFENFYEQLTRIFIRPLYSTDVTENSANFPMEIY